MNTTRRQFMIGVGTLILGVGCALAAQGPKGIGMISGNVYDRRQSKRLNLRNHPVMLRQHLDGKWVVIKKTFTSGQGYFEFKNLPPGEYIVQPMRGDAKFVKIWDSKVPQFFHAGFFVYQS